MAGLAVFAASYAFYIIVYLRSGAEVIYPLYLAPAAVFLIICAFALILRGFEKTGFLRIFLKLAAACAVFVFLFLTPLVIKANLPEPHNFLQRKLELSLGAAYALFLCVLAGIFIRRLAKAADWKAIDGRKGFKLFFASFFVFYFSVSLWLNYANQPTGDEPAYLLVTHSIVYDRDLDLKNNFENRDYLKFRERELLPQATDIEKDGKLFSYHPAALSFILAPFYAAGGRFGVSVFMNGLLAAFIGLLFLFCLGITKDAPASGLCAAITGLAMPLAGFANNISNEVLMALISLYAYYLIRNKPQKYILVSLVLSLSIWVHIRSLPVYGVLCLLFAAGNIRDFKRLAVFGLIQAASAALFFVFNYSVFGSLLPSYAEGGGSNLERFIPANILPGLAVYFFDRQLGLFAYAPVYIFVFSGAWFLWKKHRREFVEMAAIFIPYYIMIASWSDWGGGSSGPRYLIQVLFVPAACLAVFFACVKEAAGLLLFRAAVAISAVISAALMCLPWLRWDKPADENYLLVLISRAVKTDLSAFFPSFKLGVNPGLIAAAWAVVVIAVNFYASRARAVKK